MSKISDLFRENFKKSDDIRDAGLTTPEDIDRYDDIVYGMGLIHISEPTRPN